MCTRKQTTICSRILLYLLAILPCYLLTVTVSLGAEIRRLSIPRWVVNGTGEGVLLDCDYVYNENDLRLVVKWFFNDDLEPLYQWIPELSSRHVAGMLYGRLDMDFSVNPFDPYSQYRALKIKTPGPELSGRYTCLVTSMAGQDSRQRDMMVYVPARNFRFSFTASSEGQLIFSCIAEGVWPEPRMTLFMVHQQKRPFSADEVVSQMALRNSTFDVILQKNISERSLAAASVTVLECLLEIPDSPYKKAKRITYFSAGVGKQSWAGDSSPSPQLHLAAIVVGLAAAWLNSRCRRNC